MDAGGRAMQEPLLRNGLESQQYDGDVMGFPVAPTHPVFFPVQSLTG
jgi:hypothetical protein